MRSPVAAGRVVVKVGSSSLTTADGGIDPAACARSSTRSPACAPRRRGRAGLLRSDRGRSRAAGAAQPSARPGHASRRPRRSGRGCWCTATPRSSPATACVAGQVLLTRRRRDPAQPLPQRLPTFAKLLELGVLPVVNENDTVATTEIRFGDNDRLAALVAHLVHADAAGAALRRRRPVRRAPARAGSTPDRGVADVDPAGRRRGRPGRRSGVGTGGMQTKLEAARIATGAGIPVVLTSADHAADALAGRSVGHPLPRRPAAAGRPGSSGSRTRPSRRARSARRRVPSARSRSGGPRCCRPASPASPARSSPATRSTCSAPDGTTVARGLVNYDAAELPTLLGRSTRDLARELGAAYEREVVHRDDLVVLGR